MSQHSRIKRLVVSLGMVLFAFALAILIIRVAGLTLREAIEPPKRNLVSRNWQKIYLSTNQLERIKNSIEIFRIEKGRIPTGLNELVDTNLLVASDLSFPFKNEYYYRNLENGSYLILRPAD